VAPEREAVEKARFAAPAVWWLAGLRADMQEVVLGRSWRSEAELEGP
jgi:hypothetical protein